MKKLVAYFSASGVTAKAAEILADAIGADIHFIEPAVRYTEADLDWRDKNSRSSVEMQNPASRSAIKTIRDNMDEYDTIFLTFLESYDMTGKTVILFATSGGSGMGKTVEKLRPSCPGAKLVEGKVLMSEMQVQEILDWADS